jgi:hypothetical protein
VFLQLSCICLFGTMWFHVNLQNRTLLEVVRSKAYSIVPRDNVLDALLSIRDALLSRDDYVSFSQQERPILNKEILSRYWKLEVALGISFKTTCNLTGKECDR